MIYELNHAGMRIRDLDASIGFYTGLLGAEVVDRAYIPASRTDCVHLQLAGGLVELLRPADPPAGTRFGLDHIGFMTDDLDAEHERLAGAGFAFSVPPRVAGTGRGRLAFLADPNGVRVELLQRREVFRVDRIETGPVVDLDHVALTARDLSAAEAFYAGQLGMRPAGTLEDAGAGTEGGAVRSYLDLGDDALELLHEPTQDAGTEGTEPGRVHHLGLAVRDVDQLSGAFRAAGRDVEPLGPAGVAVADPDGVRIELRTTHRPGRDR